MNEKRNYKFDEYTVNMYRVYPKLQLLLESFSEC